MENKFINPESDEYKGIFKRWKIKKIIFEFIVFPAVFVMMTLGGIFSAEDLLDFQNEAVIPVEATPPEISPPLQYVLDENNEIIAGLDEIAEHKNTDIFYYDIDAVPEGELPIIPIDLSVPTKDGVMKFRNASKYELDYHDYKDRKFPIKYEEINDYQVLIVHTHSTEAYTPEGVISDDPENPYLTRSDDKAYNMIGIGDIFEEVFNENGLRTLHCEVAIDKASYSKAYDNSAKLIKAFLAEYPSIKYVFDIHRDAVSLSSGEKAKTVCLANGETAAQIMFVVGTDTLGQNHPNWGDNLTFAVQMQLRLEEKYPGLARPINVKQGAFNQHYSSFGMLIEIGCDGNYLSEAQRSARILAKEISEYLKEN